MIRDAGIDQDDDSDIDSYAKLLDRLNRISAKGHYSAFGDVDWDAQNMHIDHEDPRWELTPEEPLGREPWYLRQDDRIRRSIGLYRIAEMLKKGIEFENILQRGLLQYATTLPNGSAEFQYVYHEIAEETQHTLMFQEFINRTGVDVCGFSSGFSKSASIIESATDRPVILFLDALIGEEIIDYSQRQGLRYNIPPPLARITRIHIEEEARHRAFARAWLRQHVADLNAPGQRRFRSYLALLGSHLAARLLIPSDDLMDKFNVPELVRENVTAGSEYLRTRAAALSKTVSFFRSCGAISRDEDPFD